MKYPICILMVFGLLSPFMDAGISAQAKTIFTKSFTKKLQKAQLEFYHPVERWLKAAPEKKDSYIKHDITLHSPPDAEVRIKIWKPKKRKPIPHPHVLIMTTLATIASNHEDDLIEILPATSVEAYQAYRAHNALAANFIPKSNYSSYPKGRMLCIYNNETDVLVSYIILYEKELDPFFKVPIRFRNSENQILE